MDRDTRDTLHNHEKRITEAEKDLSKIPVRLAGGGGGGEGLTVGGTPETLEGVTPEEGVSENAARVDHQHGIFASVTALQSAEDGSFGYESGKGYQRTADGIICLTHVLAVVALA